ncbi:hypothetical protein [Candidatus Coxiella mudrowiae]|nr:hypothetical protein [Candidatus Coxiella mudrowiae]
MAILLVEVVEVVEEHANACLDAGIMLFGTNGEVIPGQMMKPLIP